MRQTTRPLLSVALAATLLALSAGSPAMAATQEPTPAVTAEPTQEPTPTATAEPTPTATAEPSTEPTKEPTRPPTAGPQVTPSAEPSGAPRSTPTDLTTQQATTPAGLPVTLAVTSAPLTVPTSLPIGPLSPALLVNDVDAYAPYRPQTVCDPTAKPGATYLKNLVLSYYKVGHSSGITRNCSIGGDSEHKEGRALDWAVNVANPAEKAAGDSFARWLTAIGPDGKSGYNARRLGVMYVIWNEHIWSNSSSGAHWRDYTGPVPHTDHVHVSLSWAGAYERTSWWTGVALPSEDEVSLYVAQVYRDLFNRSPDSAGLRTWTRALGDGAPRVSVSNLITSSREYRSGLIRGVYREFLGRNAEAAGLESWLGAMGNGMTIQSMEGGFLASPEYYEKAGGTDALWVRKMYLHVLGRRASSGEVDHWVASLASGSSRNTASMGFLLSDERLRTVVTEYYSSLLGRSPDSSGRNTWVKAIQNGTRTEQIIGGIVASDEYWDAATRY